MAAPQTIWAVVGVAAAKNRASAVEANKIFNSFLEFF
jgi:hypothetical protein